MTHKNALKYYSKVVSEKGWRAGKPLIAKYSKRWPGFKKWAKALRIMIRAEELMKGCKKK